MATQILVQEIIDFLGPDLIEVYGEFKNLYVKHLKPLSSVDRDTLDWVNPSIVNKQEISEKSNARVIIVDSDVQYTKKIASQKKVLIIVDNPKLTLAKIGNNFFVEKYEAGIHGSAVIHPEAKIGDNLYAAANVVIGKCHIGDHVVLHPNVTVNDGVIIGDHVSIKPGAVIGYDGFGYERNEKGDLTKFPQVGGLIIGDYVDVGSGCCIDRGSLGDTLIGFNTKINNLCRIAHNVEIGENVVLAGHVNISGSTIIEDNVWVSPCACFRGHQRVGKKAIIGMGAVVTKDVPPGETWVGNPARRIER